MPSQHPRDDDAPPDDPLVRAIHEWLDPARFGGARESSASDEGMDFAAKLAAGDRASLEMIVRESTDGTEHPRPSAARPAERRISHYRTLGLLGSGGIGHVFRAVDERDGSIVALKILRDELGSLPRERDRFQREAAAARRVAHPNCVRLLDAGEDDAGGGTLFAVFELIEGIGLDEHLRVQRACDRRMTPSQVYELGAELADALSAIHAEGLVHRDVKPSNVRLSASGRAILLDFGLATGASLESVTRTGEFAGSLPYAPPEQIRAGVRDVDARADVYSLGATLYECLTGKPVFAARSAQQAVLSIVQDDPIAPSRLDPDLSRAVDHVLGKALDKNPALRYPTARRFAADLRALREGRPVEARPPGPLRRTMRALRRHPVRGAAIATTVVLLVAVPTSLWIAQARTNQQILAEVGRTRIERDRAEKNLARALQSADSMVERVGTLWMKSVPGTDGMRQTLLEDAKVWYDSLLETNRGNVQATLQSARVLRKLGSLRQGLDDTDGAIAAYDLAVEQGDSLLRSDPQSFEYLIELADALDGRASVLMMLGKFAEGKADTERAIALLETAGRLQPANLAPPRGLASLLDRVADHAFAQGDEVAAQDALRRANELMEDVTAREPELFNLRGLAHIKNNLAQSLSRTGKGAEAIPYYESAIELHRRILDTGVSAPEIELELAGAIKNLGSGLLGVGRLDDAAEKLADASARLEELVKASPTNSLPRHWLGITLTQLAGVRMRQKRHLESLALHERAVALLEELAGSDSKVLQFDVDAATARANRAIEKQTQRDFDGAREDFDKATAWLDRALETAPDNQAWRMLRDQIAGLRAKVPAADGEGSN